MTKTNSDVLKGISIVFVVLIHVLAIFKPNVWLAGNSTSSVIIFLDQLARVCIPLFILISWYGLKKKYQGKTLQYLPYLWGRLVKLLPLYVVWSVTLFFLLRLSPHWEFAPLVSLPTKLFVGQADYHLYFVPLIIFFYLLFPLFLKIPHRWFAPVSLVLLGVQLVWYWYLAYLSLDFKMLNLQPDQWQYLVPVSWIWYGWLGLVVADEKIEIKLSPTVVKVFLGILSACGLWLVVQNTHSHIAATSDVLGGLKFTRIPVVVYATAMSLFLVSIIRGSNQKSSYGLATIGAYSFLIYLAHPVIIRVVMYPFDQLFDVQIWLIGIVVSVMLTVFSWWWMRQK